MELIKQTDLINIIDYEKVREKYRKDIIDYKKERRLSLGPNITITFENRKTMKFQIQEMMRAERMVHDPQIKEELDIEVQVDKLLISLEHSYSHKKLSFVVHCGTWISGEPKPLESQQFLWVKPSELIDYPFPAANAKMISALHKFLHRDKSNDFP